MKKVFTNQPFTFREIDEKIVQKIYDKNRPYFIDYLDALIPYLLIAIIMALILVPRTFLINNPNLDIPIQNEK